MKTASRQVDLMVALGGLCVLAQAILAPAVRGSTLTFDLLPTADAFVSANNAASNYGGAGALAASGSSTGKGEFDSVFRFSSSAAKSAFDAQFGEGNWQVSDVSIRLTAATVNNALFNAQNSGTIQARWFQDDSWVEGTGSPSSPTATGITAANLPSYLGAGNQSLGSFYFDNSVSGSPGTSATYPLVLSSGLMNDIATGSLLSIELAPADSLVSYLVYSRSFGTPAYRPVLSVTAVPEPSTLALCGAGLLLLAVRPRKRPR
jgi:hypothetical protein